MKKILIFILLPLLFVAGNSLAKTDLSLSVTDISFSKEQPLSGEKIRVFARVFNLGDEDAYGFVVFTVDGSSVSEPQAISVKADTYDDVFIDWVFEKGNHAVGAEIVGAHPSDAELSNNKATRENYFVDASNHDADGDGVIDSQDAFPSDKTEWQDSDRDGVGDNADTDDDNDNLSDERELVLGTSIFKADTDGDFIPDKTEVKLGFLDPTKNEWKRLASAAASVKSAIGEKDPRIVYLIVGLGILIIVFYLRRFLQKK